MSFASPKCLNLAVTKSLLMAASMGMVVPMHAAPPRSTEAATSEEPPRRVPKKEDLDAVVPGTHAMRANGTYLALSAAGGVFTLRFMDEKRQLLDRQAPRALLRWNAIGRVGEDRCVLNAGPTAETLVGNERVRPPYNFKVYVTLLDAEEKAIETVVVDFKG